MYIYFGFMLYTYMYVAAVKFLVKKILIYLSELRLFRILVLNVLLILTRGETL